MARRMASQVSEQLVIMSLSKTLTVLYLHGGPGGQTGKANTAYFDPAVYRVVLFDQRGAGKSTPNAELRENTTEFILSDIEVLRKHVGIPKWHSVFGGSWGSTLSLLYAQEHPELVSSLIVQGIFTVRKEELDWSRRAGAARIFPDLFDKFIDHLPEEDRDTPYTGYYKLLTASDRETQIAAARSWNTWDMSIGTIEVNQASLENINDDNWSLSHALLECHYFINGAWLEDGHILKKSNLDKIRHIPSILLRNKALINALAN
jgi:proline iminopeptidase